MKLLKLLFFAYASILVSMNVNAGSEPIIYSNDNSYWVTESEIKPEYPAYAIKVFITGCVRVAFTVYSEGKAVEPYKIISILRRSLKKSV